MLYFKKGDGKDRKEQQADMNPDPDEEEMEDVRLDDKREHHWRMVFRDDGGGMDYEKDTLHANRWDVYMNKKKR